MSNITIAPIRENRTWKSQDCWYRVGRFQKYRVELLWRTSGVKNYLELFDIQTNELTNKLSIYWKIMSFHEYMIEVLCILDFSKLNKSSKISKWICFGLLAAATQDDENMCPKYTQVFIIWICNWTNQCLKSMTA